MNFDQIDDTDIPEDRKQRIDALNERIRTELGYNPDLSALPYDATDERIEEIEDRLSANAVAASVPYATPNRNEVVAQKVAVERVRRQKGGWIFGLFQSAREKQAAAQSELDKANAEIKRAAALNERLRQLRMEKKRMEWELGICRHTFDDAVSRQKALDDPEALAQMWINVHFGPSKADPVRAIGGGRDILAIVIADFPKVEAVFLNKIEAIQQQISKLEREEG